MASVLVVLQPNLKHWQACYSQAANKNCNIIYIHTVHGTHNIYDTGTQSEVRMHDRLHVLVVKITVFWGVRLSSMVEVLKCFGRTYCLHLLLCRWRQYKGKFVLVQAMKAYRGLDIQSTHS